MGPFVRDEYEATDIKSCGRGSIAGECLQRGHRFGKEQQPARNPLISVRHCNGAKIGNERSFTADPDIGGVCLIGIDMHLGYGIGADANERLAEYQPALFVADVNVHEHSVREAQASGIIRVGMNVAGRPQSVHR